MTEGLRRRVRRRRGGVAEGVLSRRRALVGSTLVALAAATGAARAEATVPVPMQAQFVAKIVLFDRNMAARAGSLVRIAVVARTGDGESTRAAKQMVQALGAIGLIAGLPREVDLTPYGTAAELAALCKRDRVAVVYLSAGLDAEVGAIADALSGMDVLTVGGGLGYAAAGAVVGFELDEGRAKILVNRGRARSQNVDFRADFLKIARIVGA